ncbi:MAG: hypothetical protein R2932_32290 [Caldilineaceae bacterium]
MVEHPIKNKVKRPRFQTKRIDVLTEDECRALLRCVGFTKYVRKDGKGDHSAPQDGKPRQSDPAGTARRRTKGK